MQRDALEIQEGGVHAGIVNSTGGFRYPVVGSGGVLSKCCAVPISSFIRKLRSVPVGSPSHRGLISQIFIRVIVIVGSCEGRDRIALSRGIA